MISKDIFRLLSKRVLITLVALALVVFFQFWMYQDLAKEQRQAIKVLQLIPQQIEVIRAENLSEFELLADSVLNNLNNTALVENYAAIIKNISSKEAVDKNNLSASLKAFRDSALQYHAGQTERFLKNNILILLLTLVLLQVSLAVFLRPAIKKSITDIEKIEDENFQFLTRDRAKSEFLETISHEIRTPLNGVLGMNSLLKETRLTPEQKEYSENIEASGENILSVINSIYDYSRIESRQVELKNSDFSLINLLDEIIYDYNAIAENKNIVLVHLVEPEVPDFIHGDPARLRQIIDNLLNNAVKYTRKGEVFVRIRLINKSESETKLEFSVSDSGIGIPDEKLKNIFKPFAIKNFKQNRRFGGTGLGLPICFQLVDLMGGKIWIESEVNKGTTINVTLKFKMPLISKTPLQKEEKDNKFKGKNVLIIDHNRETKGQLTNFCYNFEMSPKSTSLESHAINYITTLDFDYILINKEDLKGLNKYLENSKTPVIVYGDNIAKFGRINYKKYRRLTYPFDKTDVYNIINEIFLETNSNNSHEKDHKLIPLNILVAEDNHINLKLIERIFYKIGYEIDVAYNGSEAVKMSSDKQYDVIIMDLQMPEMDGIDATKKILENSKKYKPKIIAMTANVSLEDKILCFDVGMVDFMSKPVNPDKVQSIIQQWANVIEKEKSSEVKTV